MPSTLKPSISLSANKIIKALTTNKNSPKVSIVTGNVSMTNMGLTNTFRQERKQQWHLVIV